MIKPKINKIIETLGYIVITTLLLWISLSWLLRTTIVGGTIHSHNVTNSNGNIIYSTVIILDDGSVVSENGLTYYTLPVGYKLKIERYTLLLGI